jgi:hypothetical protein
MNPVIKQVLFSVNLKKKEAFWKPGDGHGTVGSIKEG